MENGTSIWKLCMIFGIAAVALAGFMSAVSASPAGDECDRNNYESIYRGSSNNKDDTNISSYKTKSILQIEDAKSNLTGAQKKLSTDLLQLLDSSSLPQGQDRKALMMQMKRLRQFRPASSMSLSSDGRMADDMVYVYIYLKPHAGTQTIEPYVWEVTNKDEGNHLVVAWVEVNDLETLASQEGVRTIRAVMPPMTRAGSTTTEGDSIHHTYDVRTTYSQSGSGVKVGIIAGGVNHWTDARNSGDLPADLTILSDKIGGDEGTAMLEIVHDMVPDADLYFHNGGDDILAFNGTIDALVDEGCNIICDDVCWPCEPFFEDGIIASHLSSVLASNDIIYVSAAGNAGQEHYQGDYSDDGYNFHDKVWYIDFDPGSSATIVLQWNDKFGASGNDYDLYLCDYNTGEIRAYSVNTQDGDDDPIEFISCDCSGSSVCEAVVVVSNHNGTAATRTLEVFIYPDGAYVYADNIDPTDSIFGHPAVPGVIAVGAIDANDLGNDDIEPFSCQGPVTITYPSQVSRPKPDICGIDGVHVTGAGGFDDPFYGTSAAAPHIAAIAAQLWGACPSKTGDEIRTVLCDTAIDLSSAGYNNVYGYGRADALAAFDALNCGIAPSNIISFAPPSPVRDTEGSSRTFNIVVSSTMNVNWYINGTPVQTDTSVTEASYTDTSAELGVWTVSAVASNANGTTMQTWIWNVVEAVPPAFTTANAVIALEIAVGRRPHDDAMDVNGDGRVTSLDALMMIAITPSTGFAAVPLHLNAPMNFETGPYPTQVLPMDLDGDGDQDVAVKGVFVPSIVPYLQMFVNSGDGKLIFHKVIQQLPQVTQIVQADINRDGRMDLLGAYHGNQGGELLTLTQTESFSFSQNIQSLPFFGSTMCVGDLDGVNGPDLVIGDDTNPVAHIYLNNGAGSFSLHGSYNTEATFRDVDGDGMDDEQVPVYPLSCKCGDLDGDGDEDLIILNIIKRTLTTLPFAKSWTENIVALLNQGDGTFGLFQTDRILWDPIDIKREPPEFTNPIKERLGIEDLDNDGDLDVVATVLRHSAILIRNENNESFAERELIYGFMSGNAGVDGVNSCMGGVELCDVDGDGDFDLGINLMFADGVVPDPTTPSDDHPTDMWFLFLNRGSGIFSDPIWYPAGADIHDLAFADLNGDNMPDALTVASDDKRMSVYYNEAGKYPMPARILLSGSEFPMENIPKDIASGDFNDDGWMDLAVISRGIWGDNTLAIFNGTTEGISGTPSHVQDIDREPFRILADQLAGNPNTDVAYIHGQNTPPAGALNVVLDGQWGECTSIKLNGRPYDLAAVDMNSDDVLDLAVVGNFPTSANINLYCLAADGSMELKKQIYLSGSIATAPTCLTSVDMDDDGLDDLVVFKYDVSTSSAYIDVFLNKGNFKFDRVQQVVPLPWASSLNTHKPDVTAADVTGDGLPDIIVTYLPSNQQDRGAVRIYPNSGGGYLPFLEAYNYNLGSGTGPFRVAAAQMDNVTGLDLVVTNDDANELTILFNDGHGAFSYQYYITSGGTDALTIADFDQDGDNDVASCHHDHFIFGHLGSVSILFNRIG